MYVGYALIGGLEASDRGLACGFLLGVGQAGRGECPSFQEDGVGPFLVRLEHDPRLLQGVFRIALLQEFLAQKQADIGLVGVAVQSLSVGLGHLDCLVLEGEQAGAEERANRATSERACRSPR